MPDPTPLAQRLVEAVASTNPDAAITRPEFVQRRAGAAVVAVLRELADDFTNPDGEWVAIPPPVLLRLADSLDSTLA